MNNIKKRLEKLSRNKIYKICQKMKVKCKSEDIKKKMISKLLLPFLQKYRMTDTEIDFSVLKIGGNKYVNKHLNNLKGTPQLTIGLPLTDLPRLFEEKYMSEAVKIGQRTGTKHMFTTLYQNMEQLEEMTIAQHKGTEAYGLTVLVNSYINMFMYKHEFDGNTGMKGLPLFMSRNSFSDLYDHIDYNSKLLFEQFVMEAKVKIPKEVLYIYLDSERNCGKQFPLLVTDWLDSIINPQFKKRSEILNKFKEYQERNCGKGKYFKINDKRFPKKDLMSPPIPYISWIGHYNQRYSMGALGIEYTEDHILKIILECRECIGGAGPTTLNTFEKYGTEFIAWFTQFARKIGYNLDHYTIGFEYELSRGVKNKHSVMEYTHKWNGKYKDDKGQIQYKKFDLGSSGELHYDFADKPGMVHEYVSHPFSLEDGEEKFKKFVDDIINYDKKKAIQYFTTKERLEELNLDQLQRICMNKLMDTKIKKIVKKKVNNKTVSKTEKMKTKNEIISDILKLEWEELDEKTMSRMLETK